MAAEEGEQLSKLALSDGTSQGSTTFFSKRSQALTAQAASGGTRDLLFRLMSDMYDKEANPEGIVQLGIAENSQMHDYIAQFARERMVLNSVDLTYGDSFTGSKRLFKALATLYDAHLSPLKPVKEEHILTQVGLSSVIDSLAHHICDPRDGVLIPGPYYSGFNTDLKTRCDAEPVAVPLADSDAGTLTEVAKLEEALLARRAEGKQTRAVILCNPHNPLGFCYSRETILAYCRFAQKYNLWLLVDEIYALSLYESDARERNPFISILSIDVAKEAGCDPARVIQLYGMSKDWCANGLRVGVLVAQDNPALIQAMSTTALFGMVSSPADAIWSALLLDDKARLQFIEENQKRLAQAYERATSWLREHGVPYRPAYAGHFLWLDVRQWCKGDKPTKDDEMQLAMRCLDKGVFVAPGSSYSPLEPGFMRLTFTVQPALLEIGLERFGKALEEAALQ